MYFIIFFLLLILAPPLAPFHGVVGSNSGFSTSPKIFFAAAAQGNVSAGGRYDNGLSPGSHLLPLFRFRRTLDGVEHSLVLHAVVKVRRRDFAAGDGLEQFVDCVGERVLVANDVARRPPRAEIRVRGVGRQDGYQAPVSVLPLLSIQPIHPSTARSGGF